jgi:hypothetical protein
VAGRQLTAAGRGGDFWHSRIWITKNGFAMTVEILQGDCLEVLRTLPSESVHCCVTSPPYWGLRQYLFDNAVCLRYDLTHEERSFVLRELEKHGIKPKV